MLTVYRSNRSERLAEALARVLARPAGGPLEAESVAVHSRGMERWLSGRLALHLGVAANLDFPFPQALVHRVTAAALGTPVDLDAWQPDRLAWTLLSLLPHIDGPDTAPLHRWLDGDHPERTWQLASRVARVFDRYLTHRPDLVLGWLGGKGEGWQPRLLRAARARIDTPTPAEATREATLRLLRPLVRLDLPDRVCLFGISTLPRSTVALLGALGHHRDVHLFTLTPTREWYADIRPRRVIDRTIRQTGHSADDLHLEEGHPLVATMGRLGREFQQLLEEDTTYEEPVDDLFTDPGADSALRALQHDLLHLEHPRRVAPPGDRSVEVHATHGPIRQVEVLRDLVLGLLDDDPSLEPRDVLVLTPDVTAWAPLIEAVFHTAPGDPHHLPFRIADRSARSEGGVAAALLRVLRLPDQRLVLTDVLDLLELEVVRTRCGIDDYPAVRAWLTEVGVRWGRDAEHRAALGQPRVRHHAWRWALDRTLVGWALPTDGAALWGGVLPWAELEGSQAVALGRVVAWLEDLLALLGELETPRDAAAWQDLLLRTVDDLLGGEGDDREHLRELLTEVTEAARATDGDLPLEVVRAALDDRLSHRGGAAAFASGGVTFAAMVPLRAVPARVVCLLGLDDRALPRPERRVGFDLTAGEHLPGDRSSREEDRTLFLEALLSARDHLLLLYTGQSVFSNESLPLSPLLAELLDHLGATWVDADGHPAIVPVRHPLQPFSPQHFGASEEPRHRSFAGAYLDGARAMQRPRALPPSRVLEPLPPPGDVLELDLLVRALAEPSRAFLRDRLGVFPSRELAEPSDREPLDPDRLARHAIGARLVELARAGVPLEQDAVLPLVREAGLLPWGNPGDALVAELLEPVRRFVGLEREFRRDRRKTLVRVDLDLGAVRVQGQLPELWGGGPGLVHVHWEAQKARHVLQLWVQHLALCATYPGFKGIQSVLITRGWGGGRAVFFRARPAPREELAELAPVAVEALRRPLALFPETARAWETAGRWNPAKAARDVWDPFGTRGEKEDPYVEPLWGERSDPPWEWDDLPKEWAFQALSRRVVGAALAAVHEEPI